MEMEWHCKYWVCCWCFRFMDLRWVVLIWLWLTIERDRIHFLCWRWPQKWGWHPNQPCFSCFHFTSFFFTLSMICHHHHHHANCSGRELVLASHGCSFVVRSGNDRANASHGRTRPSFLAGMATTSCVWRANPPSVLDMHGWYSQWRRRKWWICHFLGRRTDDQSACWWNIIVHCGYT